MLRPIQADFRELLAHPATTSEFKQFEFFDLTGTLLLTKRDGSWKPLWYGSAVVTHSFRKVATPSGRQILLCEAEDAGMGHVLHYVFSVDLTVPVDARKSLLAVADSYTSSCKVVH